jgi:opacity protein-like surface antigen
MKRNVIAFVFTMLLIISSYAQTDSSRFKVMSFVPQYLINNGIRVDYEIRIKNSSWIQLCPQFYLTERGSQYNSGSDYKEVAGAGLFAYHKVYLNKSNSPFGAYFSYGLTYNFFNIDFDETNNSVTTTESAQINKFGADLLIGFQTTVSQRIVLDIYTGVGGRYSEYKYSGTTRPKYNDTYWDYGYTGNLMHLGFRIGIYF